MKKKLIVAISVTASLFVGLGVGAFSVGSQIVHESSSSNVSVAPGMGGGMESGIAADQLTSGKSVGSVTVDRSVIKTASLSLETKDIDSAITKAKALVSGKGGFIDSWSQQANDAGQVWNVSASIRVPAKDLDDTLADLSKFGRVTAKDITNSDVTTQVLDINARVEALKTSVARLLDLVAKAKSTSDLLAAENALSARQAELQSLEQQQKYLTEQVAMATIWLQIFTEGLGPVSTPTTFVDGLTQGWKALIQFVTWLGVATGWMVPWLLVLVPLVAATWFAVSRFRKARKKSTKGS